MPTSREVFRKVAEIGILIVHDDASFFERVANALRAALPGADVYNAISGPRALGIVKQRRPIVVIADGDLVGMDGYALTHEIKADPDLSGIPVIIVAAAPNEATALKARQSGAAAHLPMNIEIETLVQKVASLAAVPMNVAPAAVGASASSGGDGSPAEAGMSAGYGAPQAVPEGYGAPQAAPGDFATAPAPSSTVVNPDKSDAPHIDDLLRLMIDRGGSDLHIAVGSSPGVRQRGELIPIEGGKILTPRDTQAMILSLLSEEQRRRFETELELDFAYSIPGLSRFRANIFQQRNSMGAVFRVIPIKIPSIDELGLPKVCRFLAERPRGLVLVTGPTGSGKSTTLAAMIDHINATRSLHIITMEDPIEFMHKNKQCYVNQREVGEDTHSFASALKRVLRQDPDVILVGEMRDLETISAAITAAETGHLVLATLHTTGGPATVDRIIDVFPPHQQQQVRMQLSGTLEGVMSQVLLRSTDGKSRVMAMEIMLGVPAISNLIREGKTHQMATIIQGGASLGMQTLDQHLKVLCQAGRITFEEAISKAQEPRELSQMLGRKV
ncbi:MAG: PilT/PilU family type 4a pilus ATPase [Actinomycetota bacterium]|nr:PilT/PilU family type 4a pilus ATPase [Actinomycetota bacterium]MDP3630954.1 PilT/PilU family type 4a pilus ATPase [Actinomycetota bacterium]